MIGVRLNTFNDNSGEPEQDANSALTELDKGLRSGKVGEQCEAIVRFPRLFEKYPFPILINSSFLKLADVFRMGNNFLRLWVLRVCQQSEKHLDKILNVDEFLRRVFSVLHSNDPVARALALRTLGAVAGIIPERQNVHHAIRRGLDSHDNVEVDAAIYATTRFAAHSNTFAVAMCNKLSDMVECESTGAERRAKLVRALRTVHGGAVRAQGVLKLLRSLLERFPSTSSVRAAITALTAIAADTVVHVPDTVDLLLDIALKEPRLTVVVSALGGLSTLAAHGALWRATAISRLVAVARRPHARPHTPRLMQSLVKCPAICAAAGAADGEASALREFCTDAAFSMDLEQAAIGATVLTKIVVHWTSSYLYAKFHQNRLSRSDIGVVDGEASALRQFCTDAAFSMDLEQAAIGATVLSEIVVHCYEENLPVEGADLMLALESLVIATGTSNDQKNIKPLRIALRCLVQLSTAAPESHAGRTATLLGTQLQSCLSTDTVQRHRETSQRLNSLLEALAALGGSHSPPKEIAALPALPALLNSNLQEMSTDGTALVLICTVIFQERAAAALKYKINNDWQARVMAAISEADGWTRYRVARAALRYGHHALAADTLRRLAAAAPSEAVQRWLAALARAAAADQKLVEEGISGLEAASSGWEVASGWGGMGGGAGGGACAWGCAGCGACAPLHTAWLAARAMQLAALARLRQAAHALCTQPPPAIAHVNAQAARDPAARAGACANALRKAAKAISAVAQKYAAIARTAFHADESTLRHLHISQYTYTQLAQFLDRITSSQPERPSELISQELRARTLEEKVALGPSEALASISTKLFDNPTTNPGITHRHAEAVLAAVRACGKGAVWPRGVCAGRSGGPLCRVSLSPAPRPPPAEYAATLPLSHRLALKLEGVVLPPLPLSKRQPQRQVKSVQITVTATPHPRTNEKTVELTNVPPILTAVQTVTPIRDFFSAQQLVTMTTAGLYTVAVEAAFVDEKGELWNTGPRTAIVIKAHEDAGTKGTVQTTRGRF